MAYPAVTYTFSNGTASDASQVNQNFTDIINGISDGTKDLNVNAITAAGAVTFNGNVNLGNASGDDLTITASLASSLSLKTANTYDIGASAVGLASVYFASASNKTVRMLFSGGSSNLTWTLPGTAGTNGHVLVVDGSGTFSFAPGQYASSAISDAAYTVLTTDGYGLLLVTLTTTNRTITLPAAASSTNRMLVVKLVGTTSAVLTLDGNSSETIDGAVTYSLYGKGETVKLYCDGSNWHIVDAVASQWTTWTVTQALSTNATAIGYFRKNGDSLDLNVHISWSGAANAATFTLTLPNGITIDTTKLTSSTGSNPLFGQAVYNDTINNYGLWPIYSSTTLVKLMGMQASGALNYASEFSKTSITTVGNGCLLDIRMRGLPVVTT